MQPNVRAEYHFVAEATRRCWKCKEKTRVYAIFLPKGFESLEVYGEEEQRWEVHEQPSTLSYVSVVPDYTINEIHSLTNQYFWDSSKACPSPYWMNHCEHCKSKLGDNDTISEGSSPFNYMSAEEARKVTARFINKPFVGNGNCYTYNDSMEYFNCMRFL